jgi:DNA repair protein RadD
MQLRDYQRRAVDQLYDWWRNNQEGNVCLNMPGGSGKSVVIASIVKEALHGWPNTRVLMLVRSQELVAQNADKLRKAWPGAPLGIVCASIGKRQWGEPITYASPGSVEKHPHKLGHIDLCLIDEAHMVSAKDEGGYRKLLASLWAVNPSMRVVGFSASPYRLGHGMITDGEQAIFKAVLEPVTIEELVFRGFLASLRSKVTQHKLDATGLHIRQGDYVQGEMQAAYNTDDHNQAIAAEMLSNAANRKHWLIFCSGRDHARNMAETLNALGVPADWIVTPISKADREAKLNAFESGQIRALCNCGILSTGYDFPALDCIAFLRSTMSPGRYLQEAVRGMRISPGKTDCLVLDFAGVVATHGPITAVQPPTKAGKGDGEAPVKVCEFCDELCHPSVKICPACGSEFPAPEPKTYRLHHDDIMGVAPSEMPVTSWRWRKHTSKTSGKDMLEVTYYGALSDPGVKEYLTVTHEGYAGEKAVATLGIIASNARVALKPSMTLDGVAAILNGGKPPTGITYKRDGKYYRIIGRIWG